MFIRLGRSLIINLNYVQMIDLIDQTITFGGKHLVRPPRTNNPHTWRPERDEDSDIYTVNVAREALKNLKDQLERMKGGE